MPQTIRTASSNPAPSVPLNGHYPKLLVGDSGSVWLITGPKTGVLVHLAAQPFRNKRVAFGYTTSKLKEAAMRPYTGTVTLSA